MERLKLIRNRVWYWYKMHIQPNIGSALVSTLISAGVGFLLKALANGGVVLLVAGVLIAGAIGENIRPGEKVRSLIDDGEPPKALVGDFHCPDAWAESSQPDPNWNPEDHDDIVADVVTCKREKVIVTYFEATGEISCLNKNVVPFEWCDANVELAR